MSDHTESRDKRFRGREMALKNPYFPFHGFSLFPSVKTCPIVAPQRVLLGQVISVYPPRSGGSVEIRMILTTTASRSVHQDVPCVGEYMPCGNDGIDAHVEKQWRASVFLQRPYETQIGSPPFPHNRFENSFMRNPYLLPGKFTRRSFQQSLGKPCSVYVNSNRPDRAAGKHKPLFYHDGFSTLPQGLLLLVFNF